MLALAVVGFSLASSAHVYAQATYDRWAPIVPNITVRPQSKRGLLITIVALANHVLQKQISISCVSDGNDEFVSYNFDVFASGPNVMAPTAVQVTSVAS